MAIVIGSFAAPFINPRGLTWTGSELVSSDSSSELIYTHSGLSSTLTGSFPAPLDNTYGLTWVEGNLISSNIDTNFIYTHSGLSSTLTGSFASDTTSLIGLTWTGSELVSVGIGKDFLFVHSGLSSTLTGSFVTPGGVPGGLAWTGSQLISDDFTEDHIYTHSGLSETLIGSFSSPGPSPIGLTWTGSQLINADSNSDHIYIIDLEGVSPSTTFTIPLSDSLTIGESVSVSLVGQPTTFTLTPSDSLTLGENITVSLVGQPTTFAVNLSDSLTISETVSVSFSQINQTFTLDLSDSLSLNESVASSDSTQTTEIRTKITVAGTEFVDYQNLRVIRSQSKQGMSSRFNAIFDSPFGRHSDSFSVGQEIKVFVDLGVPPVTNIFTGIVEQVKFEGKEATQVVILRGRDYAARLMDVTVEPIVYTDSEISTIVTNIIDNEVDDITTNNVNVTGTTLARIAFNHDNVFDALKQLAELAGFIFYVDEDKDLHFEEEDSSQSGITFDNTNMLKVNFDTTREGMANRIWVYGDRQLYGVQEIISAGSLTTGSIMTLINKPRNTQVETSDFPGSLLQGGILNMVLAPTSGPDYLVNFEDRQIVFVSGDSGGIGYNTIPSVGGSVIINYDKEIPIVKFGENRASISLFGAKEDVIVDKSIQDPIQAQDILLKALGDANPVDKMEGTVKGWFDLTPGQTVTLTLENFNLDKREVGILEIQYDFDKNTIMSQKVIKLRLNNKIFDVTDKIRDLSQRISALESQDIDPSDVITRMEIGTGSFSLVGSYWEVRTRSLGSSFILSHPGIQSNPQAGGILGSVVASGINFLGDSRGPIITIQSGGNFG